jgi:hypothetical protein
LNLFLFRFNLIEVTPPPAGNLETFGTTAVLYLSSLEGQMTVAASQSVAVFRNDEKIGMAAFGHTCMVRKFIFSVNIAGT